MIFTPFGTFGTFQSVGSSFFSNLNLFTVFSFLLVVCKKTVSVLVQAKMDFTFPTVHMGEVIACAVLASLPGFPCWEVISAILSDIRGHTSVWPFAGGCCVWFWRGKWSAALDSALSCACQRSGNRSLKPSQGHGFPLWLQFLLVSSVEVPGIDDCHCDSVPPNVHIPSAGSEAELVKCRQHIEQVNTSHELVVRLNNGWSGNHYGTFGFSIPAFHTSQGFNANKRRK